MNRITTRCRRGSALVAALVLAASTAAHAEASLYNSSGEATVYIADNQTIYTWDGEPVAYLTSGSVYGFNGEHLGWVSQGMVIDHDGNTPCAVREALGSMPVMESLKSLKSLEPLKALRELAPLKPLATRRWSDEACEVFMKKGV